MIGQEAYESFSGMNLEIGIFNRYYEACFDKDYGVWLVPREDDVEFSLRLVETYKVRVLGKEIFGILLFQI